GSVLSGEHLLWYVVRQADVPQVATQPATKRTGDFCLFFPVKTGRAETFGPRAHHVTTHRKLKIERSSTSEKSSDALRPHRSAAAQAGHGWLLQTNDSLLWKIGTIF
ncbi:hypothetical protein INR49_020610, partial [Caranx melampygus]